MTTPETRKNRHIDIVLGGEANARTITNGLEAVRFVHNALPEIGLQDIDLSTRFLGHELKLPYLISSMTGGPARAKAINFALAEAAEAKGVALGVGSQRIALTDGAKAGIGREIRSRAPSILLMANIGAIQLVQDFSIDDVERLVDDIEADALILHLNPLQEALQTKGDHEWTGALDAIDGICRRLALPVIAKEVGFGLSGKTASRLVDAGIAAIDVAGAGGTSWSAVEGELEDEDVRSRAGEVFRDWGIPTARAIVDCRAALPDTSLIASGGIRTGLDVARAIRLGADIVGQAGAILAAAIDGPESVGRHIDQIEFELRLACFATGSPGLKQLAKAPVFEAVTGF